ncbi:protein of unknown function [Maridesulfovibrio hydrothermalis AM13 = DSM 14728]|uniref:Uncharacterized protein n=1 Tax=Maridesulfovibrio hydrothermalis AM13 = DSM 14728 TaxID=1121451 RepID=L0R6N3_9BACT|nr:protein of unknown function [Maridesulfovibrio hydrothermalis AM13 = DSM 14728]
MRRESCSSVKSYTADLMGGRRMRLPDVKNSFMQNMLKSPVSASV